MEENKLTTSINNYSYNFKLILNSNSKYNNTTNKNSIFCLNKSDNIKSFKLKFDFNFESEYKHNIKENYLNNICGINKFKLDDCDKDNNVIGLVPDIADNNIEIIEENDFESDSENINLKANNYNTNNIKLKFISHDNGPKMISSFKLNEGLTLIKKNYRKVFKSSYICKYCSKKFSSGCALGGHISKNHKELILNS